MKQSNMFGIVVFCEPNYNLKTLKEIGRTSAKPAKEALMIYAECPNPASQIYYFENEAEMLEREAQLQKDIKDPQWLSELFECI